MLFSTSVVGFRLTLSTSSSKAVAPVRNLLSTSSKRNITCHATVRPRIQNSNQPSAPPPSTSSSDSSSFFTPSLCRIRKRYASTATSSPPATSQLLDWNAFFRLRTSRRRYALTSSIFSAVISTGGMFVFLSTQPEMADQMTKLIPTDPFISLGIATFGATALGWLLGPMFGNGLWRLFHRSRLLEFTTKEKAFFERIKRHRVNPSGASTNNPVPDFYGEKIGSVGGYRRWLRDQRAFNRKRDGIYTTT